jgi:hypothetical protein
MKHLKALIFLSVILLPLVASIPSSYFMSEERFGVQTPFSPTVFAQTQTQGLSTPVRSRISAFSRVRRTSFADPVFTYFGDGGRLWKTSYGNYTFDKTKPYTFSYSFGGETTVSSSMFWINTTSTLDPAKIAGFSVLAQNATCYRYKYDLQYKGGGLSKDTVVGTLTVTFQFYREKKPKITIDFAKDATAWTNGGLGDFRIAWALLVSKTYYSMTFDTAGVFNTTKTYQAGGFKKIELGNNSSRPSWKVWTVVDWSDQKIGATIVELGLAKLFGGKGVTVFFEKNLAKVDPIVVSYMQNDDIDVELKAPNLAAETWYSTPYDFGVTSVFVKLRRHLNAQGTLTTSIRNVDANGVPTGNDLTSGTMSISVIDATEAKWYQIPTAPYLIHANTTYTLVLRTDNSQYPIYWRADSQAGYDGGSAYFNSGSGWALQSYDFVFGIDPVPPVNGAGSITDMDDTNNVYAQKKYYTGSSVHSDADGYADIHFCEFRIKQGATTRARFQYHEDDNTFNIQEGGAAWDLDTVNSAASRVGNTITITWKFTPQWDAIEELALEIYLYVEDAAFNSDTDTVQTDYFDVVTRLVTTGFVSNKVYQSIGGAITVSGSVRYGDNPASNVASASYPPDAEFTSVVIHDAAHATAGSTAAITNGAFSVPFNIPAVVQLNTYHAYLNMADAEYTDWDAVDGDTATCQGERVEWHQWDCTDADHLVGRNTVARVWVRGRWQSDLAAFTSAGGNTVTINATVATWDAVNLYWYVDFTVNAVASRVFVVSAFNDGVRAITVSTDTGGPITVTWTDITLGVSVNAVAGTQNPQVTISSVWAHNATAVNNGNFRIYNATHLVASGNSTVGSVTLTIPWTIHGAGSFILNGSRWYGGVGIIVFTPLNPAYSITGFSLQTTWAAGFQLSVANPITVQFWNTATFPAASNITIENCKIRFRLLSAGVVLHEANSSLFNVAHSTQHSGLYMFTPMGTPTSAFYDFQVTVYQTGSDWLLLTATYSVWVTVPGSGGTLPPGTTGGGIIQPLLLSVADMRHQLLAGQTVTGTLSVSFIGSPTIKITSVASNSSWVTFTTPQNFISSPYDLPYSAVIPLDAQGLYTIMITVTGSTGTTQTSSIAYIRFDVTSTAPEQEWTLNLGLGIVLIAVAVIIISSSGKGQQKRTPRLTHVRRRRGR